MIVPDANLLLYAYDTESSFHAAPRECCAGGNLVTDAQIAALALAYKAEVQTADRDFQRFPGLECRFPLWEHGPA